jgi:hypothetical protein
MDRPVEPGDDVGKIWPFGNSVMTYMTNVRHLQLTSNCAFAR